MKISNFLYDLRHARQYLNRCLFKYNNKIIYIIDVFETKEGLKALVINLEDFYKDTYEDKRYYIKINDTWEIPQLGFINTQYGCIYSYRTSERLWKCSIEFETIRIYIECCNNTDYIPLNMRIFSNEESINSLLGIYPKIEDINRNRNSNALSNFLAIDCKNNIYSEFNRNNSIGIFKDDEIILEEKFFYMKERILEVGIKCTY